ncbi:flagellar basal-body rod protein FlgG [Polaromonas sp. A23]|uniref:flagellar basal-body rod protein FlgG n=1 Tax=Polaromonas sp. A23 TaxID=1944133 RepID=UPI00098533EA|nr:flagellar basal-body rod protein FlgG [Polaromonas sp. A23]OOG44449.1 flagellar basal-body rod protein FlgG [Polaromonas sp. A23]
MNDALYIGATGMAAQQKAVDVVSNNIANVNTTGYKKDRVSFQDLMYRTVVPKNVLDSVGAAGDRFGTGVAVAGIGKAFSPGELKSTGNALDVAINGQGFLEVIMPDGNTAYTRAGTLEVTSDGLLAVTGGLPLKQMLHIPPDAQNLKIGPDGVMKVTVPNTTTPIEIGKLDLSLFTNPVGLNPIGSNLYLATERSGEVIAARPGESGAGLFAQGFTESSNVSLVEEIVNLMLAQRAYEVNSKVIQAADEMMGMSNNLRR